MSDSLHPTEGIRLLLDREQVADDRESAIYRAGIYTVDQVFHYQVKLHMDGSALVTSVGDPASEADQQKLSNIARSTARAAKRKRDESLAPWPTRVLRWRGPGRG